MTIRSLRTAPYLLLALVFCQETPAAWFGVWNYEDCMKTYAVPAQTQNAVGAATRACKGIYVLSHQGALKERDNCVLAHILEAKAENAAGTLVRTCREANPICRPNEAERDDACDVKCPEGKTYVRDTGEPEGFSCWQKLP